MKTIIIGTRKSELAVAQANLVKDAILKIDNNIDIKIKKMDTIGDKKETKTYEDTSLKALWTKEIEKDLLKNEIDLAVHSAKDMPSILPEGLIIAATLQREDARDVLISKNNMKIYDMPRNSRIGTSSIRREKLMKNIKKDVEIVPIRGNINTRLRKLDEENYDGIILAAAGLKRIGLKNRITQYFDIDEFMPSPNQGILAIECREDDKEILEILNKINHKETMIIMECQREFSKILGGGCHSAMGCFGEIKDKELYLQSMKFHNGIMYKDEVMGDINKPKEVVKKLAEKIRDQINKN